VPSRGVNAGAFFCVRFATLPGNICPTQRSPYSNPFTVAVVVAIGKGEAAMTLHAPAMWVFILSLILVVLAIVGIFVEIPNLSMYAFWGAVLAYVVLALGNVLTQLRGAGMPVATRRRPNILG
jgi:hypothetical protein